MHCDLSESSVTQLTGLMGFIHRSGALAPFQNMMIITGVLFVVSGYVRECALGVPICMWVLSIFALEAFFALISGLILVCKRPDCLLSEVYQKTIKEIEAAQKANYARNVISVVDSSSVEETESSEGE